MSERFISAVTLALYPELQVFVELLGRENQERLLATRGPEPHIYDDEGEADPNLIAMFPHCFLERERAVWLEHLARCPRCALMLLEEASGLADIFPDDYDLSDPVMQPFLAAIRAGLGV